MKTVSEMIRQKKKTRWRRKRGVFGERLEETAEREKGKETFEKKRCEHEPGELR